jgi:hypothetical protein
MIPLVPQPDPLPQPAAAWLLWALLQATFLLHVLAMNLVLGGAILALHCRLQRSPAEAAQRARFLQLFDRALPVAIAATVTLGVAPLLFVQVLYGRVFFVSSILMGWFWLAVVLLLIGAYYGAYWLALRGDGRGRAGRWLASLMTLAFASVAFLQVTNASRGLRLSTLLEAFRRDPRGLTLNLGDPSFWPRYLHLLLGAVAVAALVLAFVGALRRAEDPAFARWALRRGTAIFGVATVANVFVGLLFLVALPKPVLVRLAGGDAQAMGLLASGILLGVALAGAALLALGARDPARAARALGVLMLATLVSMLLLREEIRRITLREAGYAAAAWVTPQWGPFMVFVASLAVGAATIVWMVRAIVHGKPALGTGQGAAP